MERLYREQTRYDELPSLSKPRERQEIRTFARARTQGTRDEFSANCERASDAIGLVRSAAHTHASWKPGERNFIIISLGSGWLFRPVEARLYATLHCSSRLRRRGAQSADQMGPVFANFPGLITMGAREFTSTILGIVYFFSFIGLFVDNGNYYLTNFFTMMLMLNSFSNIVIINRFVELIVIAFYTVCIIL